MPADRTDFLLDYYRLLTDDIRRSEAIVPKVCALQFGVMSFVIVARWYQKPTYLPIWLAMLAITWSIHMLINANLWARRSQLMAANVEQEFFRADDMNVLLPKSYYVEARTFRYRRVFRGSMLLSLILFLTDLSLLPPNVNVQSVGTLVLGVVLMFSVYLENRNCAREYAHLVEHAPGNNRKVS